MRSSNEYRAKALEILSLADRACDKAIRNELLNIAMFYARLVDRADRAEGHFLPRGTGRSLGETAKAP